MGIPGDDQETDIDGAFTFDFLRFLKEILTFAQKKFLLLRYGHLNHVSGSAAFVGLRISLCRPG